MTQPFDQAQSLRSLASLPRLANDERHPVRCVAVSSGKGGVGKTFITVNLAHVFRRRGWRVLIVDADLGLANADIVLGASPTLTLQDAVFGGRTLQEVVCHTRWGIDLVAASAGSREMVMLGDARLRSLTEQLVAMAVDYDLLLFDCSSGIMPSVLCFIGAATHNVLVATPEPTSMMDAYALVKVMRQRRLASRVELVVNMTKHPEDARRVYNALSRVMTQFLGFQLHLLGTIPASPQVPRAIAAGRPLSDVDAGDPASIHLDSVAARLIGQLLPESPTTLCETIASA